MNNLNVRRTTPTKVYSNRDSLQQQDTHKEILKEKIIRILAIILIVLCPLALLCCFKVVKEYRRAVILRFGRIRSDSPAGPGIIWVVPCTDSVIQIDLRTQSINLPPQLILTSDYVTANVGAIVNYRVNNPLMCLLNIRSHTHATEMLTISVLRNIICKHKLTDVLALRESISYQVKNEVGKAAAEWGVKIQQVEIKDIGLPVELQTAMASEAEGRRIAKAKLIASEGEVKTAEYLQTASRLMMKNPKIMLLRYLQTLSSIASQQSTSVFFPFPIEIPDLDWDLDFVPQPNSSAKQTQTLVSNQDMDQILKPDLTSTTPQVEDIAVEDTDAFKPKSSASATQDQNQELYDKPS